MEKESLSTLIRYQSKRSSRTTLQNEEYYNSYIKDKYFEIHEKIFDINDRRVRLCTHSGETFVGCDFLYNSSLKQKLLEFSKDKYVYCYGKITREDGSGNFYFDLDEIKKSAYKEYPISEQVDDIYRRKSAKDSLWTGLILLIVFIGFAGQGGWWWIIAILVGIFAAINLYSAYEDSK